MRKQHASDVLICMAQHGEVAEYTRRVKDATTRCA